VGQPPVLVIAEALTRGRGGPGGSSRLPTGPTAELLSSVPLFSGLSRRALRRLAVATRPMSFHSSETIIREGAPGDAFFAILAGRAVVTQGARRLRRLGPGEFFGELALLDGEPRSASVVAETDLLSLRLSRPPFLEILRSDPAVAIAVLTEMARWVRTGGPVGLN
jgi:CRP-like cAMP-binding protein